MPIIVELLTPAADPPLSVVRAGTPQVEGCDVLLRTRAFVVDQLTTPTLEHVFRDRRTGATMDLSSVLVDYPDSESTAGGPLVVRISEWFSGGRLNARSAWELPGYSYDAAGGVLRVELTEEVTTYAGVYRVAWGVHDGDSSGRLLAVSQSILLVEASAFADQVSRQGPPTLGELRLELRDSDRVENFTLDDLEFADDQIAWALTRPIEMWNEETPKICPYTTANFPYRDKWLDATAGFLFQAAAQGYRRDTGLVASAGGVTVADKVKEREYLAEARRRIDEYRVWMLHRKNEISVRKLYGSVGSIYGRI